MPEKLKPQQPQRPTPCGLSQQRSKADFLGRLIFGAADQRQLRKAKELAPNLKELSLAQQEWLLYSQILKSLGYSRFPVEFEKLAEAFPLKRITAQIKDKEIILGQWAKALSLLDISPDLIHESFFKTYQQMCKITHAQEVTIPLMIKGLRPANHPWRRLTGLYYHLEKTQGQGLLKSWLKFFWNAEAQLNQKGALKKVSLELSELFPTPNTEPLSQILVPTSKKLAQNPQNLIGASRQMVILTNAVMPFFLSWARAQEDKKLEKTLFSLYLILPTEGQNSKTQKMRERLFSGERPKIKQGLSFDQGLIQIYDDWCEVNWGNCVNCKLPSLIDKG
ncbi:MAG: DUF2851 family protein [SAR324 cluster bacterium]|nr:DUF2851 family protein [SAR324 cluster bacterium]